MRPIIKLPKTSSESFSRKRKRVQNLINKEEEIFLSRLYQLQCQVSSNVNQYDDFLKKNNQVRQQLGDQLKTIQNKVKSITYELGLEKKAQNPYNMTGNPFGNNAPVPRVARKEMMHKMFEINKQLNADLILNEVDELENLTITKNAIVQTQPGQRYSQMVQTDDGGEDELEELKLFQSILYLDYQIERFRVN